MKTTLNKIREHSNIRADGLAKLIGYLGKTEVDDESLSILTVLDGIGFDQALLCLRAVEGHDREVRLFAVWCARRVQYLMANPRCSTALDVSERFARGLASAEDLASEWDAASVGEWAGESSIESAAEASAAWAAAKVAAKAAEASAACAALSVGDWRAEKAAQSNELRRVCQCVASGIDPYPVQQQ